MPTGMRGPTCIAGTVARSQVEVTAPTGLLLCAAIVAPVYLATGGKVTFTRHCIEVLNV